MSISRLKFLTIIFAFCFLLIIWRLFYWQVLNRDRLVAAARSQQWSEQATLADRGEILASDGYPWVTNKAASRLYLNRTLTEKSEDEIVRSILPLVIADKTKQASESARLTKLLSDPKLSWIKLFSAIPTDIQKQIEDLKINGLVWQPDTMRTYPEASTAAHLLGFVAANSADQPQGYFGLEGAYQRELTGLPGKSILETDAVGNPIVFGQHYQEINQPGRTLITHIDRTVQYLVETKLAQALEKYGAVGGTVTVMDPIDGAVLAMAALPDYHPGEFSDYPTIYYSNPVISQSYEPGSTFKVLVMAAALEEKLIDSQTVCPCRGPVTISPYTIETWNQQYYPNSNISDIIKHSDNVGMVFVAQLFAPDALVKHLKDFGLGQVTGVDLQEEASPALRDTWREIDLATVGFGQGIAVTPIQMLTAVAALANDGWLMQPQVVDKIRIQNTEYRIKNKVEEIIDIAPKRVRQVVSVQVAREMTEIMVNAAKFGEAKWTFLKGYQIAGKTGTAQIPISGHYDQEKTIVSFVGFAPANDPKFVMLVTLREPSTSPWGSETAAPLWFAIARELFLHWEIAPVN